MSNGHIDDQVTMVTFPVLPIIIPFFKKERRSTFCRPEVATTGLPRHVEPARPVWSATGEPDQEIYPHGSKTVREQATKH